MTTFYNEFDPHAAQWLRNLAAKGLITDGKVDERSITEIKGSDLVGFDRCHFFGGIGGWDLALQLAGWPADNYGLTVWTGSCPCQPFSVAGKRQGEADERHLWPDFCRLIGECLPDIVFGEQVSSKDGRQWLAGVHTDLEKLGYTFGAIDTCAASLAAPHIRQRLYWMAIAKHSERRAEQQADGETFERNGSGRCSDLDRMGSPIRTRLEGYAGNGDRRDEPGRIGKSEDRSASETGDAGGLELTKSEQVGISRQPRESRTAVKWIPDTDSERQDQTRGFQEGPGVERPRGFWSNFDIVPCADGKARRVESGLQCLVNELPFLLADGRTREGASRSKILKGLGNAIVPQLAAEFIKIVMEYLTVPPPRE